MANHVSLLLNIYFLLLLLVNSIQADSDDGRKAYVVYMGHNTQDHKSISSLHLSMLQQVIGSDAERHMLQRYTKSFHGFSVRLTKEEAQKLSRMEGVVSVFPSRNHQLATTSSWDFMGFPLHVNRLTTESDIIVGVFDTGIWPESTSFSDVGFGPPPAKWKGSCQGNFTCNNKIIGARYFKADGNYTAERFQSPRDSDGHGTHTASTAAGNIVSNANLLGLESGTARGGVPRARIAVYKVCWQDGCEDQDILSAFEAAIDDGVDIISISAGGPFARKHFEDAISIGSFYAMKEGILTIQSAGNDGPMPQTIISISPWILAVAAGTKNPELITRVKLGNGMVVNGVSVNTFTLKRMYPLIHAVDAPNKIDGFNGSISRLCINNSLDHKLLKGKIILCDAPSTGEAEMLAGAVGSIMGYAGPLFEAIGSYPLPVSVIDADVHASITKYIQSTRKPKAVIMKSEESRNKKNPYVASFSSRGPNQISNKVLKPDLTAPGVRILAAWSPVAPITEVEEDHRSVKFNIISGTSMACPHVSGIAAYVKSFHPTWSPTAIKSALMTTASIMTSQMNTDAEFAYGAGYLNPTKAIKPGLVYDASEVDYASFLCHEGYNNKFIRLVTGDNNISCSQLMNQTKDLNYPTFVISTLRNEPVALSFNRIVTNVGLATSTYKALITQPFASNLSIEVEPNVLPFKKIGQTLSFKVFVNATIETLDDPIVSGALTWTDGVHQVRSAIVVHVPT